MKRVFHTWDKWECYPAGFYEERAPDGSSKADAEARYADFLRDAERFRDAAMRVIVEWPNSTEHYLTNERMNRIAWIGQAAACLALGLPSLFRAGYHKLTPAEQAAADGVALDALNVWLLARGETPVTLEQAQSRTAMDLY